MFFYCTASSQESAQRCKSVNACYCLNAPTVRRRERAVLCCPGWGVGTQESCSQLGALAPSEEKLWWKCFGSDPLLNLQWNSCNPQWAPVGLFPDSPALLLREQCLQQSKSNLSQKRDPQRLKILFFTSKPSSFDDELEPKHNFSHSSSQRLLCARAVRFLLVSCAAVEIALSLPQLRLAMFLAPQAFEQRGSHSALAEENNPASELSEVCTGHFVKFSVFKLNEPQNIAGHWGQVSAPRQGAACWEGTLQWPDPS